MTIISSCSVPSCTDLLYLLCNFSSSAAAVSAFFVAAFVVAMEAARADSYALSALDWYGAIGDVQSVKRRRESIAHRDIEGHD
jgi:hypothetical protein